MLQENKKEFFLVPAFLAGMILIYFYKYLDSSVIINASDVLSQQYFWEYFWHDQLHNQPTFSSWLPYTNGGTTLGGALNKIFRPLSFAFYYFFEPNYAMSLDVILHFWLMAFGTYLFARVLGLSTLAALLGAIFFAFASEQVSLLNAGHIGKINTIAWTPIVFWGIERGFQKRRLYEFVLAGIFLSAQLYEGHIQISFYVCMAVGIYFIARLLQQYFKGEVDGRGAGQHFLRGTLMVFVFLSLSAFTLTHWLEFKGLSERSSGTSYEFATSWSMPPKELITYIVPQFFGLSRQNYYDYGSIKAFYWGDMPFTQTSDYLGLLPLILLVIALLKCRGRQVYTFLGLALFLQFLAFGKYNPLYPFFYEYFGLKFFRVPKMNLFLVSFFVSILGAYGANWLFGNLKTLDRQFIKKIIFGVLGLTILLACIAIYANLNRNELVQYYMKDLRGGGETFNPSLVLTRYNYALQGIWIACILFVASASILSLRLIKKVRTEFFFMSLLAFFIFDSTLLNYRFMDVTPMKNNDYFSKDIAIKHFEKDKGLYRVLNAVGDRTMASVPYRVPNKYILYKIQSATGYEAVQLASYNGILDNMRLGSPIVDLMNIKYIVMLGKDVRGKLGDRLGKYQIVAADKDIKVLKNNNVLPRAYPVHQAKVVKNKEWLLNVLISPSFDPRKVVLIEEPVDGQLSPTPLPESQSVVKVTSYKNNEIKIDVKMAENGFVFLGEKYYPGWKASVDGNVAKIYRANYAFRSVFVPKGQHRVIMKYEPEFHKKGLYITFLSIFLVGMFLVRHYYLLRNESHMEVCD